MILRILFWLRHHHRRRLPLDVRHDDVHLPQDVLGGGRMTIKETLQMLAELEAKASPWPEGVADLTVMQCAFLAALHQAWPELKAEIERLTKVLNVAYDLANNGSDGSLSVFRHLVNSGAKGVESDG